MKKKIICMKNRYQRRKIYAEINVTPFVDVMLVLLVIFMVTTPMLITGMDVDLPTSTNKTIKPSTEPLTLSINKSGKIFIMKEPIALQSLKLKLKNIIKAKKESRIFIKADKSLNYGYIMNIVSAVTSAGFDKISLITESK